MKDKQILPYIPFTQPLGLTTVDINFIGSSDLLVQVQLLYHKCQITDLLIVDDIAANPVAGETFNISGQITSDNGSGLEQIDGTVLPANILFELNGETIDSCYWRCSRAMIWNASIQLSPSFAAGNNTLSATYFC